MERERSELSWPYAAVVGLIVTSVVLAIGAVINYSITGR